MSRSQSQNFMKPRNHMRRLPLTSVKKEVKKMVTLKGTETLIMKKFPKMKTTFNNNYSGLVKTSQKCQPLSHLLTHFPLTPHLTTIQAILREEIHMIQEHLQVCHLKRKDSTKKEKERMTSLLGRKVLHHLFPSSTSSIFQWMSLLIDWNVTKQREWLKNKQP